MHRTWQRGRFTAIVMACGAALSVITSSATAGAATVRPFGVIAADTTVVRHNLVRRVFEPAIAFYQVRFGTMVQGCAHLATPGDTGSGEVPVPATAAVSGGFGAENRTVFVATWDQSTGTLVELPFHLAAFCEPGDLFAVVDSSGTVARGSHVTSATRLSKGRYLVNFDRSVDDCAYIATIGSRNSTAVDFPGVVSVARRSDDRTGVVVSVTKRSGEPAGQPFHLVVTCDPNSLFAVVDAAGTTVRGANVVSSAHPSTGRYEVVFNQSVSECAYLATIGGTGTTGFREPVTITTGRKPGDPNGVALQTRNVDGSLQDAPFHLTVVC